MRYPFEKNQPDALNYVKLAEGIFWFRQPLPMALKFVNIYVLDDGDGWVAFDTGMNTHEARDLWQNWLGGALKEKPLKKLIMTHHHPDHVGLVGWFMEQGVEILATRTSYFLTKSLLLDVQERWPEDTVQFYHRAGMEEELLHKRSTTRPFNYIDIVHPFSKGYRRIKDGDHLKIGDYSWIVRTGGGHAAEQATFWHEKGDFVLSADAILPKISPNVSVHPSEPDGDPLQEWLSACKYYARFATDTQLVLPGHKDVFYGLPTRIKQHISNHEEALERLYAFIKTPKTAREAFDLLFKREIKSSEYTLALGEAVAHMNHLWHQGRAERFSSKEGRYLFKAI